VIDGKPLVEADMDVVSSVGSAFVTEGVRTSVSSPKTDVINGSSLSTVLVGRGSRIIVELSAQDVMIDDVSCIMGLASRMLVSETAGRGVVELRMSTLGLKGRSVTKGNIEVVSKVAPMSVVDDTEASDWTSLLAVISEITVGCSRGNVVKEPSLSSTELLTES